MFDGRFVSVGLTVSTTVTLKVPAGLVFPGVSLAVQLTVVVPNGNVLPDDGLQLTFGLASTASVALGLCRSRRPRQSSSPHVVMSPGTAPSDGGVVSCTVTVNEADPEFE